MSMPEKALVATTILSLAIALWAILNTYKLNGRFSSVLGGKTNKTSLEQTLRELFTKLNQNNEKLEQLRQGYAHLSRMTIGSLQKVSMVRFNPFSNTGGDQSFVLAVLNSNDTGFLLTSIHSREGTRVYIKPVEFGASQHNLSEEEQQALTKAIKEDIGDSNA